MDLKPGFLVSLDGIDGVGKSTQIQRLENDLRFRGFETLSVRDPGSTPIGTRLREILLDSEIGLHRRTEAMLFMASRCEMLETTIRPALADGRVVISDRFLLANVVYQSVDGGVAAEQLWQMGRWANDGVHPDLTILLDMPADAALKRLDRATDRMESRGVKYLHAVREAFLTELAKVGGETAVVDAAQSFDAVSDAIRTHVDAFLTRRAAAGASSTPTL